MSNETQTGKQELVDDFLLLSASVGDALQLQDTSPAKNRYYAKLVGYLNKHSITVTQPRSNGKLIDISVGEEFFVRGFSGAKTYEFNATVLGVCSVPYPYVHLSFPERVSTLQMRGAMRIKTRLTCSIIAAVGGLKMPATINDLSTSGASIQSPVQLGQRGEAVQINLNLPIEGDEQSFVVSAIIRNVGETMYGVEFVGTTNRVRIALQTYVYSILIAKQAE